MDCLSCGHEMVNYTALTERQQVSYDMCEACGGLWLDHHEFQEMTDHLRDELDRLSPEALRAKVGEELEKLVKWAGGTLSDVRDAGAALSALLNATIFQHPRLFRLLMALPAF